MCGIAGVVGARPSHALTAVQAMTCAMARRGPDAEGLEAWPEAVLGQRRLAILDLSDAGKQPMVSADRNIGLVFNGCIYNFQELRHDLESHGYRFHSQTDTEVLLHGYRHWGIQKLTEKCRGMFAFAIWDHPERKLILVRDRLGVKPLVFAERGGEIAFASTVEALRQGGFAEDVSASAILEFLEFGWVSDDLTIYGGVQKVPAATILQWQAGKRTETCYWKPPAAGSSKISFDDAVDRTAELLIESVKLRLIADVPVGSLLSGGIDSGLVAWALSKLNADLTSYTISTPGHPADETEAARQTARILGVPHQVIQLSASEQPALEELISAYGEPFACSSALAMLQVCKAIKPQATVLLTGDGGDDVFLGYGHHRNFWRAQRLARLLPGPAASLWPRIRPAVARVSGLRRPMHLMDYAASGLAAVTQTHDGIPYFERGGMLGERLNGIPLSHRSFQPSHESGRNLMEEFLNYERGSRFVSEYMTKVDGAAMYYSMEARSPFLDQKLWEFASALPWDTRLRGGELKAVLRALTRRELGQETANRKKQGFTVPVSSWLIAGWKPQLDELAEGSLLEDDGWLRRGSLRKAISAAVERRHAPVQLWYLVVLENWLRTRKFSRVETEALSQ